MTISYTSLPSASFITLPEAFAARECPIACYQLNYLLVLKYFQGETQSNQTDCLLTSPTFDTTPQHLCESSSERQAAVNDFCKG